MNNTSAIKELWVKVCNSLNWDFGIDCTKPKFLPSSSSSSSKDLPIDIQAEILSRLPVKSLVRFTCVCKSWYSLIKNPHFISTHLNRSISNSRNNNNNNGYLLVSPCKFKPSRDKYFSVVISPDNFVELEKLELPICTRNMNVSIVNSCNGVICLTEWYPNAFGHVLYVWNLSIRVFKALPFPQRSDHFIVYKRVVGFGYDNLANDYKVVRILYFKRDRSPEVEVHSLSTDSWRRIRESVDFIAHGSSAAVPFVNGAVHWMGQPYMLGNLGKFMFPVNEFVMAFDMGDEVFRKIGLPQNCRGADSCLMEFKELLSVYVPFRSAVHTFEGCYIWVMGEYGVPESWSKQYAISVSAPMKIRPLGFAKNGKLMFDKDEEELVSLDLESLQVRDLGFHAGSYAVDASYMESLVLLEDGIANLIPPN